MFWKKKIEKKCNSCGKKIDENWNYCPFCGINLKNEQVPKINFKPFPGGFSISIISGPIQSTSLKGMQIEEKSIERKIPRKIKETKEPKLEIKTSSNQKIYIIHLPKDIKMNDIEITRLPNSIEIRAFYNDLQYFKIIEIPQNKRIIKKELSEGKLMLFVE
ncbi:MAG: zinc ribbon domain-containing protein [Candidatus Aenigmarchaeota archaeon]|nr:zinc ribbon domain-containing protein [Candidatus Aenigmarchaeota archaeon]